MKLGCVVVRVRFFILVALAFVALVLPCMASPDVQGMSADAAEKLASERNHQAAGLALIVIGILVIASRWSPRFRFAGYVWTLLFVAMGVFLAAWSDAEIWPRGPLPWTWLIHHDAEARQHKIYAVLLVAMGLVEFLNARGKLSLRWQRWSFPLLALCGAALLTMHSHAGTSGLPPGWSSSAENPRKILAAVEPPRFQDSASHVSTLASDTHQHHAHDPAAQSSNAPPQNHQHGKHQMTPSMVQIQQQHLWMTLVGIIVAFFKFVADGRFVRHNTVHYIWPGAMAVLGVLLLLYRE